MRRKKLSMKVAAAVLAAATFMSTCPVSAFAVTGSQVAADGVNNATAHVESDDDWSSYNVTVGVTVEDGKFKEFLVTPTNGYEASGDYGSKAYFNKAVDGSKKNANYGIKSLIGKAATQETIDTWFTEDFDTTSNATITRTAIKNAAKEALSKFDKKEIKVSELQAAIDTASSLSQDEYTTDSWNAMQEKLTAAKAALTSENQTTVDTAAKELQTAIDALVSLYKYVYASVPYVEYYAAEDVLNGDSDAKSDEFDTNGESDKGAFDAVSRATTNHGLHRGSFQTAVTINCKDGSTYKVGSWKDNGKTLVLTDGTEIPFSKGVLTVNGEQKEMENYIATGIKYVPVQVKTEDYDAFKNAYDVVENGETLSGGYSEGVLSSYSYTAAVDANTNGLKKVTKKEDGTFSFGKAQTGTTSGLEGVALKTADVSELGAVVQGSSSYGDFIRLDLKKNYGDLGASMQSVEWTYYGDGDTVLATYGTKFAADNWMHKSNGIQLGLTDSLRCQLPAGSKGTGKWVVTIHALGYTDTVIPITVTENDIHVATPVNDTSKLEEAIANAAKYDAADYSASSWSDFQNELKEAQDDLKSAANHKTSQESVDESTEHLNDAISKLEKVKSVYAAISYTEYYEAENVLNGNSAESSDVKDTHGESDKGAFDVVTRATKNHGLHRGSFQSDVTIYCTDDYTYKVGSWEDGGKTLVLTDGTKVGFNKGEITDGDTTRTMDHYEVTGIKYVPVQVKEADYDAFKEKYAVVENGGTLTGGYGEGQLSSYSYTAAVDATTNGLREVTKNEDGTFSFEKRLTGTGSGLKDVELKTADISNLGIAVQDTSSYGDFIRFDLKENYGDLGASMQAVEWTYYGDGDKALATYGTKFAADNWMHKSNGIQLGLTDSLRCQLPAGTTGAGKWVVTIHALGYADTVIPLTITEDDIHTATPVKDTSKLEAAIKAAEALNKDDYTEESWSSLETELKEAQDDLANAAEGTTSQESVDESTAHLNAAIDALVKKNVTPDVKLSGLNQAADGNWYYYVDGEVASNYTGFAKNSVGEWYVENGKITFNTTKVVQDTTGVLGKAGDWYYVAGSYVQHVDTVAANEYGWFKITNGKVDFNFNGLAANEYGWWKITGGAVDFNYNGLAANEYGWWKVTGGAVDFNYNGLAANEYGWWKITGGAVDFNFNGLCANENGWWKLTGGCIDFSYNGIEKNEYGWWKVTNGKVDFSYNGKVRSGLRRYNVVNGKVDK